jgi:ABC-type amino acid transport substrate-binding protein
VKASIVPTLAAAFTCFACAVAEGVENDNAGTLRVCLNESVPPYSVRQGGAGTGFDLLVAEAVAKRLGQSPRRAVVREQARPRFKLRDRGQADSASLPGPTRSGHLPASERCEAI